YVEPHERIDVINKMTGIEVVPLVIPDAKYPFSGEIDVAALIKRRPQIILVDEIAHSNAPGSINRKRYQDIIQLLHASINVITTSNIQHLESLAPTIEQDLSLRISETIPDSIITTAEIVNVDLPVKDLIKRIKAGKVYHPSQIERALHNFCRPENLNYLRKLTLAWLKQIPKARQ
ncbi:MAG: hypothetical protein NTY61_01665, partial [Candidatus Parcubacteria bacterium]|nr:hypothetical protein [Candidatus Parcubacteria bacterium]